MEIKSLEKTMDINLALALVKCLDEHLHSMQWTHSNQVKQKFNRLFKVAKVYEKEVNKSIDLAGDKSIDAIYDALMDSILEAKQIALEGHQKEMKKI